MAINAINGITVDTSSVINGISGIDEVNGLELSGGGGGGIAYVAGTISGTKGADVSTSDAINTTGANFLIVSVSWYTAGVSPVITDSKGNTWTPLTSITQGDQGVRLFYCIGGTVGSGHTFTATGVGSYITPGVMAFSGVASFHTENGNGFGAQPGAVTPAVDGSLIITAACDLDGSENSPDGGFTFLRFNYSTYMGGTIAYLIQPTAASVNPTYDTVSSTMTIADFAP